MASPRILSNSFLAGEIIAVEFYSLKVKLWKAALRPPIPIYENDFALLFASQGRELDMECVITSCISLRTILLRNFGRRRSYNK